MIAWRRALAAAALLVWHVPAAAAGDKEAKLSAGNTAFAVAMYRRVRQLGAGNVFFSPFSISEVLAMAWAGARGETARQMASVLHFPPAEGEVHEGFRELERRIEAVQAGGKLELVIANSLWPQEGEPLLPRYLTLLKDFYGAAPTSVDYRKSPEAARTTINRWVEKKTRDKIKDILPANSVGGGTKLVLVNAIYFKGKWKSRFDKALTQQAAFQTAPGRTVSAPFMRGSPKAGYLEVDGAQILRLPYEGGDLSLVVLLPRKAEELAGLEDRLTANGLTAWLSSASRAEQIVEVWLPRFHMDFSFELKAALTSLGMTDAFDAGRANFEAMSSTAGFFIHEGYHKAFVDVNEEGTEAAAASALSVRAVSIQPQPVFRADHPFLFLIRDDTTGTVLFLGRINDPTR